MIWMMMGTLFKNLTLYLFLLYYLVVYYFYDLFFYYLTREAIFVQFH